MTFDSIAEDVWPKLVDGEDDKKNLGIRVFSMQIYRQTVDMLSQLHDERCVSVVSVLNKSSARGTDQAIAWASKAGLEVGGSVACGTKEDDGNVYEIQDGGGAGEDEDGQDDEEDNDDDDNDNDKILGCIWRARSNGMTSQEANTLNTVHPLSMAMDSALRSYAIIDDLFEKFEDHIERTKRCRHTYSKSNNKHQVEARRWKIRKSSGKIMSALKRIEA